MTEHIQRRVESYILRTLEKEKVQDFVIEISDAVKTDGAIGDIYFIKATGTTADKQVVLYNFVLKLGKAKEQVSQSNKILFDELFDQEIYMHGHVFPFFEKFQQKHGLERFDFIPKCFDTIDDEEPKGLVMENLKASNYTINPKNQTLNFDHVKAILEAYGKLHALSFSIKQEQRDDFEKIIPKFKNCFDDFLNESKEFVSLYKHSIDKARKSLEEKKNFVLLNKLNDLVGPDPIETYRCLVETKDNKSVIIHGDCWNNNFMFQYNKNKDCPTNVAILDWQLPCSRSPAFDISHFIYAVCAKTELDRFDELLSSYYNSFSSYLKRLGSSPEELFSYSELMEHWNKYSKFGLLMGILLINVVLADPNKSPSLELDDEDYEEKLLKCDVSDQELYYFRLSSILEHYFASKKKK